MNDKWLYEQLSAAEEQLNSKFEQKGHSASADYNRKIEAIPTKNKRLTQKLQTLAAAVIVLCLTGTLIDFIPVSGDATMLHETFDDYGTCITLDDDSSVEAREIRIFPAVLAEHYVHKQKRTENWFRYFSISDNRSYHYQHDTDENKRLTIYQQSIPYTSHSFGYLNTDWQVEMIQGYRVSYACCTTEYNASVTIRSDAYWYEDNCLVVLRLIDGDEEELLEIISDLFANKV